MRRSILRYRASQPEGDGARERSDRAERLVAALEAGDGREEIYRELYELYRRPVYACFARRGLAVEECHDLTQETFLRLFRGLQRFRGQSRFETWLFEITTNVWRNAMRDRAARKRDMREVRLEEATDEDGDVAVTGGSSDPEPLDDLLADERVRLLREALEELPPQMRRCVQLRLDQDLKFREIAVLMHVSIDTVKSQMAQAKQKLKLRLGEYFGEWTEA